MRTVELEDLVKEYGESVVKEIIETWQNGPTHPLTCTKHSDIPLEYSYAKLYCSDKSCFYNQYWIPSIVVDYWKEIKNDS